MILTVCDNIVTLPSSWITVQSTVTTQHLDPDYDTHLARSVTAPATTGDATLVPDKERHPSFSPDPRTPEP